MEHQQPDRRSSKRSSRRMEEDLNRSSFRQSEDSGGRPPSEKAPRTSGADPSPAPKGSEHSRSGRKKSSSQSRSGHAPSGTIPVVASSGPPQEGHAAAVASVPASGQPGDGSNVGNRGAIPMGYEHGAEYGGRLITRKNSSLVDDAEAASRVEYLYQKVQGHASRTPAYNECPTSPSGRKSSLRSSFDGREGESQSTLALQRMEGIMARLEQHLVASTSASSKPASSLSTTGEFSHSFSFNRIVDFLPINCGIYVDFFL
jgi:hypothetical protein